ncbi:hypothetical protein [Bifidobacterium sp.]|uniref:hypothetical protein n=1 Tax=Bifidobacterium sp. TaxID=41200 RepID=UPI003D7EDA1F
MTDNKQRSEDFALSDEQKAAVAELAETNVYTKQSKFKTFRELPMGKKWSYFKENFLTYTIVVVLVVGIATVFGVSYLTKAPDPVLAFEGINMSDYSDQLDSLGADFAKSEGIKDSRLVSMDTSVSLTGTASGSGQDGSTKLLAMVSAGQVNVIAADAKTFAAVNRRDEITKPSEVMDAAALERIKDSLVDAKGKPVSDVNKAVGFDLSKSATWTSMKGLPDKDVILGFSNITKDKDVPIKFINYLRFE